MKDSQKGGQGMFFPLSSVSNVMAHPETPEYFAFATVVTGDSKHKCHLFQQTKVPSSELIQSFQAFMQRKVLTNTASQKHEFVVEWLLSNCGKTKTKF